MKKIIFLAFIISTTAFANSTLEQFAGEYELVSCKGDVGSNSITIGEIITITTGNDWVNVSTPSQHTDYVYNDRIERINGAETQGREENQYACINYTEKSTFKKNEVTQRSDFVSYPFCKGIPMAFGKIIFQIKNLGNDKISILKKHTMIENYTCYYQKI